MTAGKPHTHVFDPYTHYCLRCGASREDVEEGFREVCAGAANVVAISHVLSRRRLAGLFAGTALADLLRAP